jgi:hypothetical protein
MPNIGEGELCCCKWLLLDDDAAARFRDSFETGVEQKLFEVRLSVRFIVGGRF